MAGEGLDEELAALKFEIEAQHHHMHHSSQMPPPQDAWLAAASASSSQPQQQQQQHGLGGPPPRRGGGGRGAPLAPGSKNVVCIHYLVGMCALDKDCPYLHQYDLDRVPICP
jgi:hypothetical protein